MSIFTTSSVASTTHRGADCRRAEVANEILEVIKGAFNDAPPMMVDVPVERRPLTCLKGFATLAREYQRAERAKPLCAVKGSWRRSAPSQELEEYRPGRGRHVPAPKERRDVGRAILFRLEQKRRQLIPLLSGGYAHCQCVLGHFCNQSDSWGCVLCQFQVGGSSCGPLHGRTRNWSEVASRDRQRANSSDAQSHQLYLTGTDGFLHRSAEQQNLNRVASRSHVHSFVSTALGSI